MTFLHKGLAQDDSRELISHRRFRVTCLASGTCSSEVNGRYWRHETHTNLLIDDAKCFGDRPRPTLARRCLLSKL